MRPGPCTEDGFTQTTGTPSSDPSARTLRSASNFERSYCGQEAAAVRGVLAADDAAGLADRGGRGGVDDAARPWRPRPPAPRRPSPRRSRAAWARGRAGTSRSCRRRGRRCAPPACPRAGRPDRRGRRGPAAPPGRARCRAAASAPRQRLDAPALGDQAVARAPRRRSPIPPVTKTSPARSRARALRSRRALPARTPPKRAKYSTAEATVTTAAIAITTWSRYQSTDHDVGSPDRQEDGEELHVGLQLAPDRGRTTVPSAGASPPPEGP